MDHYDGHSAKVEIRLEAGNAVFGVAQVGRDSLLLREGPQVESGFGRGLGKVIITVDGRVHEHDVILHQGIEPNSRRVHFG